MPKQEWCGIRSWTRSSRTGEKDDSIIARRAQHNFNIGRMVQLASPGYSSAHRKALLVEGDHET